MTDRRYETTRIADLEREHGWSPIRQHFGVLGFGINAWTAHEAGDRIIPAHDEVPSRHEELYLVTAGRATFTVEEDEIDAPAGTIVFVRDPAATRGAVAREKATTVLAVGGTPGEVYRPRAWESNADIVPLFDSGDHEKAKQLLMDALERYDDRSVLYYNLACAEAQLGESDAAVEHLRAAVSESPSFAGSAGGDPDLAPIRDDPRFAEIVATAG